MNVLCFSTESYDPDTKSHCIEMIRKIEKFTRIAHTSLVKLIIPLSGIPGLISSYYLYYTTDLGSDVFIAYDFMKYSFSALNFDLNRKIKFFLVSYFWRFPFDNKTPIGYAADIIITTSSCILMDHTVVCVLGLMIGFYGLMMSFGQSIQRQIRSLRKNYNDQGNEWKINEQLRNVVRFHAEIKKLCINLYMFSFISSHSKRTQSMKIFSFRLNNEFTNVMEKIITIFYSWSLLAICDTLLMYQVIKYRF